MERFSAPGQPAGVKPLSAIGHHHQHIAVRSAPRRRSTGST
jgi:hypothetical protein